MFDIIMLSYNEPNADIAWGKLFTEFPWAKRVDGVKGIFEAHHAAAKIAKTEMFYVVDADAELLDFDFSYTARAYRDYVHVWRARNPVNGLEYGYGGLKLFPREPILSYTGPIVDFTTTVSKKFKVMPEVASITAFNTGAFETYRSAYRECAKLASNIIHRQRSAETLERLDVWCSKGIDAMYGEYCIAGANAGKKHGTTHSRDINKLALINDYDWLYTQFKKEFINAD